MKREKAWQVWTGGFDAAVCLFETKSPEFKMQGLLGLPIESCGTHSRSLAEQALSLEMAYFGLNPTLPQLDSEVWTFANEVELKALLKQKKTESLVFSFSKESPAVKGALAFAERVSMNARFPLWDWPSEEILRVFFNLRFEAFIISVDERKVPPSFLGKPFRRETMETLPKGSDPAGHRGEFGSWVVNGPFFQLPLKPFAGPTAKRGNYLSFSSESP